MSASADPAREKIATACPNCGKRFAVGAAHVGRQARCPQCEAQFVIAPVAAPAARTVAAPAGPGPAGEANCGICQSPLAAGEAAVSCPACKAPFHEDCWQYNRGCGVYGCAEAPPTEGLSGLEIPPSFWGREEKACPQCGRTINAAAVRCRFCGATFSSARPQAAADYRAQRRLEGELPALRKAAIWLLVLSLIPCTAPLAGLVGILWYFGKREAIRALPVVYGAIWKIAVGVALAQTGLLIVFGLLAGAVGGS